MSHLIDGSTGSVWLERLEAVLEQLELTGGGLDVAVAEVLDRVASGLGSTAFTTLDFLADAMLAVVRIEDGDTILDPAAGEGTLVLRALEAASGTRAVAYECDADAWDIAVARAALSGADVDLGDGPRSLLRPEDLFIGESGTIGADVVVVDPPLENLVDWVTLAAREIRDGGRAVIAVPLKELTKPKGNQPPWRYLKAGTLEAIVVLPARQRTDTAEELALLVVAAGRTQPETLLIDARPMGVRKGSRSRLEEQELERLRSALDTWRSDQRPPRGMRAVVVEVDASSPLPDAPWPEAAEYRERLTQAVEAARALQDMIDEDGPLKGAATDQLRRALRGFINVNASAAGSQPVGPSSTDEAVTDRRTSGRATRSAPSP